MADISVQEFGTVGISPVFVAASAGGDTFTNYGGTFLFIKNGSGAAITATVDSRQPCSHGFDHDLVTSVPAGQTVKMGPFPPARFNDENSKASVAYSAVASVTVAVVRA